jgi:hypothetical protein
MGHFVAIPHENITWSQSLAFSHSKQPTTMKITDHRIWQIGLDAHEQVEEM